MAVPMAPSLCCGMGPRVLEFGWWPDPGVAVQAGELSVDGAHVDSTVCGLAGLLHISLRRHHTECWLARGTQSGDSMLIAWPHHSAQLEKGEPSPRALQDRRVQGHWLAPQAFLHHGDLLPAHQRRWAG